MRKLLIVTSLVLTSLVGSEGSARLKLPLRLPAKDTERAGVPIKSRIPSVLPSRQQSGSIKFDEYGSITAAEQRKHLDDFAIQLRAQPKTQAYIIAYGGRQALLGEARVRALWTKRYLVKKCRIASDRIVIVDGGYREEATTELFIRLENGKPPVAFPTVDRREVKIGKARQPRGR